MRGKILILDDEKDMLRLLERIITEDTEHRVVTTHEPVRALSLLKETVFDLVITDLKMPQMDGIRFLEAVRHQNRQTQVVLITAFATIETAVEAIRKGAYDYITKPFRRERILITIDKVMKWRAVLEENESLKKSLAQKIHQTPMIGTTAEMKEIFQRIRQVAPTTATVLITGSSGVGKEVAAKALHENSDRADKKFVTVNCTAIPEHVMESELFGHVKGAFTGAWKTKKGLVEEAHLGTLFLDEIADLKPALQTKLLRLLQEGEYKPVGSEKTHKADIRFIAATNHDLTADIREKRFREDLYYRLNVVRIHLPPLKERKSDIPALSFHFLRRFAAANRKDITDIEPEAMRRLLAHDFPGNIRELENLIERGVIFCRTKSLTTADLCLPQNTGSFLEDIEHDIFKMDFREAKERAIELFHQAYLNEILSKSAGNISRAAHLAKIQRQYLHRLIRDVGIDAAKFRDKNSWSFEENPDTDEES